MADAVGPGVVEFLFEDIQPQAQQFINEGSADLIGVLAPAAAALFTIYVLLIGVGIATGHISEPFTDFIKRVIRMAIIIALAMTVGVYQGFVADALIKVPTQLASTLSFQGTTHIDSPDSMAETLDGFMQKGFDVAQKPWDEGNKQHEMSTFGISGTGLLLQTFAAILMCIVAIVVAIAAGIMFVALIALAMLLAIGPLFILFAIFPQTQRWAEAWLGQTVNYGLIFVLVACATALLFKILEGYFNTLVSFDILAVEVVWLVIKAICLAIGATGVLLQVNSIASGLAGGAALQATNLAGKLASVGVAAASGGAGAVVAGAKMARSAAGVGRAINAGIRGEALPNRYPRTNRQLAHGASSLARQVFTQRNSIAKD